MKLLTVAEVADVLSVSKSMVYALISRGELPYVPVGMTKGYRVSEDDVYAFVLGRKKSNKEDRINSTRRRRRLKHINLKQ